MKLFTLLISLTLFFYSCNWNNKKTSDAKIQQTPPERVKMLFYNPDFRFDSTSRLRIDGYYEIRENFGSYTTNDKDYYPNDPTYGYIQLFSDGFCKVGWWNGFFQSPAEIKSQIVANNAFGFWGIYKISKDTLLIEYLQNPASPGVQYSEQRSLLSALIVSDEIIVTTHNGIKYSYPEVKKDSLTSSCIGKFISVTNTYKESDNYLKKEISKYR